MSRRPGQRFNRGRIALASGSPATNIAQAVTVSIVASLDAQTSIAATVTVDITASLSGYTPQSEASPLAWIDIQDAAAITLNGGSTAVTQIQNKISTVQWTTPVNDTPYEATGINGHPCLHPIVIGDRIMSSEAAVVSAFDCPNTTKPYTIYYVVKADSTTTGVVTFGVGNTGVSSGSTRTWGQRSGVATYEYAQTAPASNSVIRSTGAVTTAVNILCWHSPGTGVHLSTNNAADDPNDAAVTPSYVPGTGPNQLSLFSRPDLGPDSPAIQRFGELWVFGAEHDASARTRVYNYLSAKWA